jgi:hypothetical protein
MCFERYHRNDIYKRMQAKNKMHPLQFIILLTAGKFDQHVKDFQQWAAIWNP